METLDPGTQIERYTVQTKLGEGGVAAVYKVTHDTLGTVHALKVLTLGGQSIRKRLVNEGRVQAGLEHPYVLAVRDVLDVNGAPGLLMDFVEGPDLETWREDNHPDAAECDRIFRAIVGAVQAAHRKGVVHRDLKPANVLMHLGPDGVWTPRVADFGLAKAVVDDEKSMGTTRAGVAMGTPAYMAPEQIRDASTVDHRADVWALGCILYHLVTGRTAFQGVDIVEIYNAVSAADYPDPRQHAPQLEAATVDTIARCLQVDVNARLSSCEAVLAALDQGPPETPPAPAAATSATRPATRRKWAISAAIAAVILGATTLLGGAALVGFLVMSSPSSPLEAVCASTGSSPGYVRAPQIFLKRQGTVWVLPGDRKVHATAPDEASEWTPGDVVCELPAGTRITLVESPQKRGRAGTWVRIEHGQFTLPEEAPAER